jgi:uncharacterized membrane protein
MRNWAPFLWTALIMAWLAVMTLVSRKTTRKRKNDEAKGILENRYALGEIDDEEFAHRMEVLAGERRRYFSRTSGGSM